MNAPIRRVALAAILVIALGIAGATWMQFFNAATLRANPDNQRTKFDSYKSQRGQIFAGDVAIALSRRTTDKNDPLHYQRVYPTDPAAFAPVTGYFSYSYGNRGIESAEDAFLRGDDDDLAGQRFLDSFSDRDPRGGNIVTTIDPKLQRIAYRSLMDQNCDGPCRGSLVAIQPSTGKILALASTPSYDPNPLTSHDTAAETQAANKLGTSTPDPRNNRGTVETFPPGSTFKVLTTLAAFEQGIGPDTRLTSAPSITIPGTATALTNYSRQTCPGGSGGQVTLEQAFEYSCNTAFVELSTRLRDGSAAIKNIAKQFGVDDGDLTMPLRVAGSTVGPLSDKAQLAQSVIGQRDVRFTTLQNAWIAATIANGGKRMQPYLVDKRQDADLATVSTTAPRALGQSIKTEDARSITELMRKSERVMSTQGRVPIASKTGTAEHSDGRSTDETPYAWYMAFGDGNGQDIAVAVIIENSARGTASTGGTAAAPVARAVIEAAAGQGG